MQIFSTSAAQPSGSTQLVDAVNKTLSIHELSASDEEKYKELYVSAANKKVFAQLGLLASEYCARTQLAFNVLQVLVARGADFEDMIDVEPDQFVAEVRRMLADGISTIESIVASPSSATMEKLAQNLQYPSGLTIRPSKRFAGGSDIVNSGIPSGNSDLAQSGNFVIMRRPPLNLIDSKQDEAFESNNTRIYSAEIAQGALRAAQQLYEAIFGKKRPVGRAMFDTDLHTIPLNFKWSQLNAIFDAIHPLMAQVGVEIFRDVDTKLVKAATNFMSIGLRAMPSRQITYRQLQNMRADQGDVDVNPVAHALSVEIESGLILSLRKEFVEYISQGDSALKTLCLYRWYSGWASYYMTAGRTKKKKGTTGAIRLYTKISQIPRYVTSATSIPRLQDVRKECGYQVTDTQSDENGLTMMPNGMPAVLPKREDIDLDTVAKFESEFNSVLEDLYEKGIPFSESHNTLRSDVFSVKENDLDIDRTTQDRANSLAKYRGICLGVDPDFATIVRSASQSIGIASSRIIGAKAPTALDTADILGFDFAEPGESPNFRSAAEIVRLLSTSASEGHTAANILFSDSGSMEAASGKIISGSSSTSITINGASNSGTEQLLKLVADICATYGYMARVGKMPKLSALVKNAAASLGYDEGSNLADSNYDRGLYNGIVENDLSVNENILIDRALFRIMVRTLNDAAGLRGSNLLATLINETGSIAAAAEAMEEDPHYFKIGTEAKLADMGRLVNYLGGAIFREACEAILKYDRKKLYALLAESADAPNSNRLQHVTLPFATIYARCAPNALEIFSAAEEEVEKLKPDTSITAENIQFPGLKQGTALMPHQLGAHQTLRRRPRYATIFIAPGGGKTIIGLTDIGCMMKELEDLGQEQIRPLILCPTNLVANWCDDLHKIADGWNAVPITSDTVGVWTQERLYDVIMQAPKNTIFVAGLSFLSTGTLDVDIGGVRVRIRGAVEFVKRFNFSYVLLDESHKAKNMAGGSAVHLNTKAVFTVPSVRYARIATGTLVTDIVTDVVGQAALMSPTIFGSDLDTLDKGDGELAAIRRAHSRLSNHTAFIAYKRKHWAFMLPSPIDTFFPVNIDDSSVPHSDLHKQVYDAMYQQLFDMLNEAAENAKKKGGNSDDDEGGSADENDSNPDIDPEDNNEEEGDVLGSLLANNVELNVYFQRMEMMLTDPMGDDIARETFEQAGVKNFVSVKVTTIIDRIKQHFEVQAQRDPANRTHQIFEWKPGVEPRELDIAVYDGKKYLARKHSDGYGRADLPPSMVPPPQDPDYWKEEKVGKLIVFTRYTRSANAIYNALPPNYKKIAVLYHGEVSKLGQDKGANLDAFKTDPTIQILIANEQAISEGHNMQMGSRIIRCDTPWSPGVYDQSTARIFRPDVSAAVLDENGKPGDMAREVVFIDWIMTNKTLEVGKVARLMWKTLQKTQFDEKGNELYEPLDKYDLRPIRMNAELLIANNEMEDFEDYFAAKAELNSIEQKEFADMRKTTVAQMIPLTPAEPLRGFGIMEQCPIVNNQKIPDRHGYGLTRLRDWTKENEFIDGEILKRALYLMPVVTEFGNGQIVGISVRNEPGTTRLRADDPISTVRVRLHGTDELMTISAAKIHVATKVTDKQLEEFFKTNKPWATETDRKRVERMSNNKRAKDQIQDEKETQDKEATRERLPKIEREAARQNKRAENKRADKPINEGVKEAAGKVRPAPKPLKPLDNKVKPATISVREAVKESKTDMAFTLTPTVYNGFIALYADVTDPDTKMLKEQEFVEFGSYVYVDFYYYEDFEKFLDFIEKKYEFDNATAKRLEYVLDVFASTGRMSFNQKQAVKLQSELRQFFLVRHRAASDKKHVKAYPMVMEDRLRIMIDVATNPMATKFAGKKIPNTRKFGTFEKADGMWIGFLPSVAKAKAKINKIIKAGYTVSNLKKCVAALDKIKATKDKSKSA
ncbi:putative ATP-dependent DNA helicase [Dickeya phage vB_DsoM_JA13]|uniref:Putative ATP-dependent DNA helicase n=1 Tax=Dickeya phage vB_DsoM_JA13 TaxID=2283030 RepID=A0A384ZWG2_9CAUD|nr:putative ATP-dependent DNA helicase [Dickeya phage vB_DsoM_JA13]